MMQIRVLRPRLALLLGALWVVLSLVSLAQRATAATLTIGVVALADDVRYQVRRLEHGYPGHPGGRPEEAVRMALDETEMELVALGHKLQLKTYSAPNATALPALVAQLKAAKLNYLLLDLPDAALHTFLATAPAALPPAVYFNIGSGADDLRGSACSAVLLHTYPSDAMRSDALAQFLAAHAWSQALVLYGPSVSDKLQLDAFVRSAHRYGVKLTKQLPFKLSTDPRERDLANVRLLTNDKNHDVVVVIDSDGEFARSVPYNTQWARPVVGSAGLVPVAWQAHWDLNGGPQLTRRFAKLAHRSMAGQDWAAWAAVKSIVSVLGSNPKATAQEQLRLLRSGQVYVDGFKGPRLSFRPWDGQLRQPVFLADGDGVAALAPFDGVMHPTDVLDTLGMDEKESICKQRP